MAPGLLPWPATHPGVILVTAIPDSSDNSWAMQQSVSPTRSDAGYAGAILASRRSKDRYLRKAPSSPLRRPDSHVQSLSYFPVDPSYRIVVAQLRRPGPDDRPITLETSDGERRVARRVAFLDFELHGQRLRLTGFSIGPTPPGSLFVPFADVTNGHETYGSGRYLDLEVEPNGSVVVDFNLAYHPYCAYSNGYSCPLTPPENRLQVPVLAGERLPR